METDIVAMVLGKTGGIFALGIGVGATGGWGFCQKHIVQIYTGYIEEQKLIAATADAACKEKIDRLETRVMSLEDERVRLARRRTDDKGE